MSPVMIYRTSLSFRVAIDQNRGIVKGTSVDIREFTRQFVERSWHTYYRKYIVSAKYYFVNTKTEMIYYPLPYLGEFLTLLTRAGVQYEIVDVPPCEGVVVSIPFKDQYQDKDALQTSSIEYASNANTHLRGLAMQTGRGKTYCAIRALSNIGRRSLICVDGLVTQWFSAIRQYTNLRTKDIYIVQGHASVAKLLTQIDRIKPKIILCSLKTLIRYCKDHESYENYPPFDELCDRLGIGVRIIDEAHENFATNLTIDLRLNCNITIPLSATFDRNEPVGARVFDKHYPSEIRFGAHEYKRYVDIFAYEYGSGYNAIPVKAYTSPQGYSGAKYEAWMLKNKYQAERWFVCVVRPIIDSHYVNRHEKGTKCLILCTTIAMCQWLTKRLKEYLKDQEYAINYYVGETDDKVIEDSDIIVSTPGSCGTGRDIKGLITCTVLFSTKSANLNKQCLGRLREHPEVRPHFITVYDRDIAPQRYHAQHRKDLFKPLGLNYKHYQI